MRNELSIYLRDELLSDVEIDKIIQESEGYATRRVRGNSNGVEYKFVAKDIEYPIVKVGEDGVECEITGYGKQDLTYKVGFSKSSDVFGMANWSIMFKVEGHDISKTMSTSPIHLGNVLATVSELAKKVSNDYNVRFFNFYGVQEASTKKCVHNKYINREDEKRKKIEARGGVYKRPIATTRSRVYARQANSEALGSAILSGNDVVIDMGILNPEMFDETNQTECAKFGIEMQRSGIEAITKVQNSTRCNNGKINSFSKQFKFQGEQYGLKVDDSYNIKLGKRNSGNDEVLDEYSASSIEDLVSKIDEYINNPLIEVDVKELMKKLNNQLLGLRFKLTNREDSNGMSIITYKQDLNDDAHLKLVVSEEETKINLDIAETFDIGGEVRMKEGNLSSASITKLISYIKEFVEKVTPSYEGEKFFNLPQDKQLDYLVDNPNKELEHDYLKGLLGNPVNDIFDKRYGYSMRYKTKLSNNQLMYEDLRNENHMYNYVVKILDENMNQTFFKHYDAVTIKKLLEVRAQFRDTITDQLG